MKPMSVGMSLELPASLTGDFKWAPFREIPVIPWRDWFVGVSATATNTPWVQAGLHDLARDRRRSSKDCSPTHIHCDNNLFSNHRHADKAAQV